MNIESLREYCLSLPHVIEDVKWGHDLCFCIAEKMFCVTHMEKPHSTSFKVKDDEFDEMSSKEGLIPAPYMARHKWVMAKDLSVLNDKDWKHYIKQSYELVKAKLPAKLRKELNI